MQALIASVSSAAKLHGHISRHCLSVAIPDHWVSPSFCSPLQQCSQSLGERGWKPMSLYLPHLSTLSPKLLQITYCFLNIFVCCLHGNQTHALVGSLRKGQCKANCRCSTLTILLLSHIFSTFSKD